jgi:hypothetical protein
LRRGSFNAETREKWLKEGRGSGTGAAYKSWLTVHDISSARSKRVQILETRTERPCNLLSTIEEIAFLSLDFIAPWDANIYEQFRLDLAETLQIAEELDIPHPRVPNTREPWDMTTDLVVVDQRIGEVETFFPFSCKPTSELDDWNQLEHSEIERVYWSRRESAPLKFIVDKHRSIPIEVERNLKALTMHRFLHKQSEFCDGQLESLLERLIATALDPQKDETVKEFCDRFSQSHSISPRDANALISYAIYRRYIRFDLREGNFRDQSIKLVSDLTKRLGPPQALRRQA